MRRQQPIPQPFYTEVTVPFRRENLLQASLFDAQTYRLPEVVPGQAARIYDADEWERMNGRRGIVTDYSYFTELYTINVDGIGVWPFYGREIMKVR